MWHPDEGQAEYEANMQGQAEYEAEMEANEAHAQHELETELYRQKEIESLEAEIMFYENEIIKLRGKISSLHA